MQVLVYLFEHAGSVVSRSELEQQLWPGRVVTEDAVTNAIAKLRRVFGDDARHPRVIETVSKIGYRLIAHVNPNVGISDPATVSTDLKLYSKGRGWRSGIVWAAGIISVLLILVSTLGYLGKGILTSRSDPLSGKPAVAIMPFKNLGITPEQDYFANGITADLITDLSKVSALLVIAPGSVFAYKDSLTGPRQISSELDVDYVVMGSVQRLGDRLRVNVQLMEAGVERAIWGERYDSTMNQIFSVQDRLVTAVIMALKVELGPTERTTLSKQPTNSVAAYDHYLQGYEAHGHRSREQNLTAREHFQRAIQLDPGFARAYAGLALTHSRDAIDGWTMTPERSLEQAAELAGKAAVMDPSLPQVHFVSAQVDLFRHRHLQAIEAAQRAIEIEPNYADAYALSAWILNYAGRPAEALTSMEMAMRLNPRPTASYLEVLGEIRFVLGQYKESVSIFERVLNINPNYTRARMWNVAALAHAGFRDRADWEAIELLILNPNFTLTRLEFAFPFQDPRELDKLLSGLKMAVLPD